MEHSASTPALRPLGVGETLDAAIKLYRANFVPLVLMSLAILLPVQILSALIFSSSLPDDVFVRDGQFLTRTDDTGASLAAQALVQLLGLLASLLVAGAVFRAVTQRYLGQEGDVAASARYALARLGSLFWLGLLTVVALIVPFLLLILPGIYLLTRWAVAIPALMVEDKRGAAALSRSFELTKGRFWPVFGTLLVGYLLIFLVGLVLGLVLGAVIANGLESVSGFIVVNGVIELLAQALTTPLVGAIVAVIYFDLRVRKEGYDIELASEQLGLTSPGSVSRSAGLGDPSPPSPGGSFGPPGT